MRNSQKSPEHSKMTIGRTRPWEGSLQPKIPLNSQSTAPGAARPYEQLCQYVYTLKLLDLQPSICLLQQQWPTGDHPAKQRAPMADK